MRPHLAPHRIGALAALAAAACLVVPAARAASPPGPNAAAARAVRLERSARFTPPAPRESPVLTQEAVTRLSIEGRSALWVLFTDKGIADERAFAAAVRAAGERLTERARARRAREQGGVYSADYDDVPVVDRYVQAVVGAGAAVRHVSKWLNGVSVMADEPAARRIAALPFVRAIVPLRASAPVTPVSVGPTFGPAPGGGGSGPRAPEAHGAAPSPQAPLGAATLVKPSNPAGYGSAYTQLNSLNVPAVHDSGYSAAGVILAMFDTGFDKSHSATVQLKRLAEWDFVWGDSETANQIPPDGSGQWDHGTGTWSVAGGYWPNNLVGAAYNATFALAKTEYVPTETHQEEDNWVAAAEWADSLGVDVISSSLAYLQFDTGQGNYTWSQLDGYTTIVVQGAVFAHRRGILVANAMGNNGPSGNSLWSPADADSILSCGAVDTSDLIAGFSSRGNTPDGRIKPEVVAQGVNTIWAVAGSGTGLAAASGTSLSTPLVGGSAALVREAHPEWTVEQVREAMMDTADKDGVLGYPDSIYGHGRIDVRRAIWSSPFGPPVYPRPFDLLVPPTGAVVTTTPVTLKWRRTTDPNAGDSVASYTVTLVKLPSRQVVFTKTTPDSFAVVTGNIGPSTTYEWSVTATDLFGHGRIARQPFQFTTGATTEVATLPHVSAVVLGQNQPNPFVRKTSIPFSLEGSGEPVAADLRVYDARGRLVRTLFDSSVVAGLTQIEHWDGTDDRGRPVAAGVYFYRLRAGGHELVRRLVLVR